MDEEWEKCELEGEGRERRLTLRKLLLDSISLFYFLTVQFYFRKTETWCLLNTLDTTVNPSKLLESEYWGGGVVKKEAFNLSIAFFHFIIYLRKVIFHFFSPTHPSFVFFIKRHSNNPTTGALRSVQLLIILWVCLQSIVFVFLFCGVASTSLSSWSSLSCSFRLSWHLLVLWEGFLRASKFDFNLWHSYEKLYELLQCHLFCVIWVSVLASWPQQSLKGLPTDQLKGRCCEGFTNNVSDWKQWPDKKLFWNVFSVIAYLGPLTSVLQLDWLNKTKMVFCGKVLSSADSSKVLVAL